MKNAMVFMVLFLTTTAWGESIHSPVDHLVMVPTATSQPLPVQIIADIRNAPNPFDSRKGGIEGKTQLSYWLADAYPVNITVYDLLGMRVRHWEFSAGDQGGRAGVNSFFWDGTNETGDKVSKGGYVAQIEVVAGPTVATVYRKIGVIH